MDVEAFILFNFKPVSVMIPDQCEALFVLQIKSILVVSGNM